MPTVITHLLLGTADTDEPFDSHCHCGIHRDGEADLGQGEDERDEVGGDVERIMLRKKGDGENKTG